MKHPNVLPCMSEWAKEHLQPKQRALPPAKTPLVWTPATSDDLAAIKAIARVNFPIAIGSKRFAAQIQGATELTPLQRDFLWRVVWRFRRQIADKRLVGIAESKGGGR